MAMPMVLATVVMAVSAVNKPTSTHLSVILSAPDSPAARRFNRIGAAFMETVPSDLPLC